MEIHHQILNEGKRDVQQIKQKVQLNPAPTTPPSPPSATSSPSHEFSFTISLHPPTTAAKITDNKTKSPPPPQFAAVDLTPADEIFFHGHLLPLHLLSHQYHPIPAASPRTSTNSIDNFTLPIKELLQDNHNEKTNINIDDDRESNSHVLQAKRRGKSRSFSQLFDEMPKWRKGSRDHHNNDHQEKDDFKQKMKSKFDIVKRYVRLVKPFLLFRNRRENPEFLRQRPFSYSGNLRFRKKTELRGRRGEFSAPVSMRTSPTNSGVLVASGTFTPTKSDSTMEELQAAIQAAIAHCKKSIAAEEKEQVVLAT